ncbi:hypothetical protein HYH02_014921 [Chlamydomonas schloesseri]|uniref:Uncharacterized protein n=1 Tax=Chlamydomonas schloesseri TaxID=2026947 RepID=A0A835SEM7_9CHLO|nr:hypothetical protein HYH02_014921 [Chlamydomonas schloesseri]|eukprot:KAG2425857.1 hypothetical protein HYH02_014921 [Chlamydomonas schloesseri]
MLAQLTRQAEENTRILQREREALGIQGPSIFSEQEQPPHRRFGGGHGDGRGDGRGGRGGGGAANNQRNNANNRRNHIFTDQGNKKVFDPRNIPGLGGAADNGFDGGDGGNDLTLGGEGGMLNQTFPDSPNFYPGFVFAIPGTLPPQQQQQQQQQQAPGQAEASLTVISAVPGQQGPGLHQHHHQQYPPQPQQPGPPQHQQHNQQGGFGTVLGTPGGGGGHGMGPGGPGAGGLKGGILGMSLAMNGTVIGGQQRFGGGRGQQQQQQQQQGPFGNGQGYGGPPGMGGGAGGSVAGTPNGGSYGTPGGGGGGRGGGLAALAGGGGGGPVSSDPRVQARMEAEAKKEAYRRELEEQIRARQAAKDAEVRRRREEEEQWEARARQAPPPWDPAARAQRRGGGGEPLRDDFGRPVADLRARPGRGSPGGGMAPSPGGFPPPPGPPQQRLTVEVPGGGAGAYPPGMGPMHGDMMMGGLGPDGGSPHGGTLMPMGGGPGGHMMMMGGGGGGGNAPVLGGNLPLDGPPVAPGAVLSPNAIPPVSPGNRRFMAAMNDLIAGPSDEQRRNAEEARQRLQSDLEAQIREKKERQARERAERERERLKEEADLKAYYDNMNQPRGQPRGPPGGGPPQQPPMQMGGGMGMGMGMGMGGMGMGDMNGGMPPPGPGPRRRGKGVIVDASWLDAPKPPQGPLPPLAQQPQPGPPMGPAPLPAQFGRRGGAAGPDDLPDAGPGMMIPRSPSPGPGPGGLRPRERGISYAGGGGMMAEPSAGGMVVSPRAPVGPSGGGGGGGGNTVTGLLHQLQEEQSRMREDFARQAAAMEKLASDASRALADRDEAWRELQRVKALLAGGAAGAGGAGGLGAAAPGAGSPGAGGLGFGPLGILGLGGGAGVPGPGDSMEQYAASTVVVNTHLVPKSLNAIPDALPKPLACEVLRRGHTDPGPHGSGIRAVGAGGGGGGGGRGGGEGRFSSDGGAYDGGFGYDELERFQAQLRVGGGGSRGSRSGIPLPPGMGGPRSSGGGGMVLYGRLESLNGHGMGIGMTRAPGRQSVYGQGFDSPSAAGGGGGGGGGPKGQQPRYNGFFSGGPDPHEGHGSPMGGGGGGGMGRGHPPHLAPLKPPPSPGILRGDHLPSPSQKTRPGADKAAAGPGGGGGGGGGGGSRVRSGRNAVGGPPERQPRSAHPPQAPSAGAAAASLAARAARNPALEHGGDGAHPSGLPPPAPRSAVRRSSEGMQRLLMRRGREGEKLSRTNPLARQEAGGGVDSHLPEYSMDELPSMADAEMAAALGVELEEEEEAADDAAAGRRAMRQREHSMPGHSEHVPTESGASMLGGGGPHLHPHLPDETAHSASQNGAAAGAAVVAALPVAAAGAAAHHDDEDGYSDDFHHDADHDHDHDDDHHQQQQQHGVTHQEEQQQDQQSRGGGGGSRAGRLSDGGFGGVAPKLQHTESVATYNSFMSAPWLGARVPSPVVAAVASPEGAGDDAAGSGGTDRALLRSASGSRASRVSAGGSATAVGGGAAGIRALQHGGGGSRGSGNASAPGRGSAMDAVLAAAAAGGGAGGSFGKPGSAGNASAAAAAAEAAGVPVRRPVRPGKRTLQRNGSQSGVPQDDAASLVGIDDEGAGERGASDEE